ncbi:serine/threonine-protein kinase [Streptomyces sp. GbtcB6]|uniref:serine/threonine-protein kinase n=1 Tax=Streptomyces sp. GbtcB6 TaxID=2824751 RepID=UPI001C3020DE|nr:serine/threonine-protein kinase [Streptomyces sp. GbtcB6]
MSDEGRLVAGRYRLTERIGRGGMGTVWRAEDEVLGRQVALKQLHPRPHLSDDELATLYERTRREARSAARVVHPNVVVVHDVVDDDGRPCVVMEYVAAPTLADLLDGGRTLPPEEAARIGLGMIGALRAAHAAGVLHRDVKPGNVLLGPGDRIVLTDFGIALTAGSSTLTQTGQMVGSIAYMAPERLRGLTPGPASDLWSLGATLYQTVEGRPPFRRGTAMETAYAIVTDPVEPMKQAGPLEPLVQLLLAKDPADRPSAEQTERALLATWSGASAEATRRQPTEQVPAGARTTGPVTTEPQPTGPVRAEPVYAEPVHAGPVRGAAGAGSRRRRARRGRLVLVAVAVTLAAAAAVTAALVLPRTPADKHPATTPRTTTASSPPSPSPLPQGYHLVTDKALGVSFPVPDGWTAGTRATDEVTYKDPTGLAGVTIGMVEPAGANPVTHLADIEANTKVNYPTYRRLRMQRTAFRGQPAAIWEFTFRGRARVFRAIDLGYGTEGGREYDIYLSAPDAKWDTYRPVFDNLRDGFRTTG